MPDCIRRFITKKQFMKVYRDSSREDILGMFFDEHISLREAINLLNEMEQYLIGIFNVTQDTKYLDVLIKFQDLRKAYGFIHAD